MLSGIDQTLNTIPAASVTQFDAKLTSEAFIAHILSFVTADTTVLTVVIICTFDAAVTHITDILTFLTESTPFTGICWTADTAIWAVCSIVHGTLHTHPTIFAEFIAPFIAGTAVLTMISFITVTVCFVTAVISTICDPAVAQMSAAILAVRLLFPRIGSQRCGMKHSDGHRKCQQDTYKSFGSFLHTLFSSYILAKTFTNILPM